MLFNPGGVWNAARGETVSICMFMVAIAPCRHVAVSPRTVNEMRARGLRLTHGVPPTFCLSRMSHRLAPLKRRLHVCHVHAERHGDQHCACFPLLEPQNEWKLYTRALLVTSAHINIPHAHVAYIHRQAPIRPCMHTPLRCTPSVVTPRSDLSPEASLAQRISPWHQAFAQH